MIILITNIHSCTDVFLHIFLNKSMRIKNKNKKLAAFICIAVLIFFGYYFWIKPKYNNAKPIIATTNNATEVSVIKIKKQQVQLSGELPGRVSAYKISEVRPQIEGVIKKRKFEEGSFVREGQQLYQIDPNVYQIAFDNAKQNLKTVRAKRDRYKNLLKEDAISKQEFDDVSAAFAKAEAEFKQAKTNLTYTEVRAPISGYIGKSNITEGMLVTANQDEVLTTIAQLDPIYVDMVQSTKDMADTQDQKNISVTIALDDPSYKNTGKLKFSEVFADESTDSIRLRALFSNKDKKLIPGMFVTATLHLKPFEAITVPQRVTNIAPGGILMVWVVDEENTAKPRPIKADKISGDNWIVESGLNEGDVVIYEGYQKLFDGAKVKPVSIEIPEKKE